MAQPNGNGMVSLSLKDRALSVTGKDVVMIVFILVIGVIAYLRTRTLDAGLTDLKVGQAALTATIHEQVTRQNDLLAKQTTQLQTDMDKAAAQQLGYHNAVKQMLLRLNYNIHQPTAEQLSLDLDMPIPMVSPR